MQVMTENDVPVDACGIAEASAQTGVSERLIRTWSDEGKIWKGRRHGWRVMVSPSEIAAYNSRIETVRRPGESEAR